MKIVKSVPKWSIYPILLIAILGGLGWQSWRWWQWASAPPAQELALGASSSTPDSLRVAIPEGTSARQIGQDLQTSGVIRSATAWDLWARWLMWKNPQGGFQAGTYELSAQQSLSEVATKIWNGEVVTVSFTIPEGYSLRQMAQYFEEKGFFKSQDFLLAVQKIPRDRYPWLPDENLPHLEGFLYPDTYKLADQSATPQQVIDLMLQRFEQVALPLYRQNQQQTSLSLLEWVTLASIVEKEAVVSSERPRIAGVFVHRLQKGIPLGADPTVEYGLGVKQTPDSPLTLAQVTTPSAYNTYLNVGLPPTPIASAGFASLKATLSPEPTPYLYFVARYDGTHIFSRTLAEHEAAQNAIRAGRDRQSQPSPKPSKAAKAPAKPHPSPVPKAKVQGHSSAHRKPKTTSTVPSPSP
ncbi:MAG: endolytic transglycosylase MltG [Scytolyngbya sp. HA4215-MV1]|nr:endolytic transglycosylase MltG [Scytolyngbya sp. HA4215-MV1]